jgi:hypothetical protein
LGAVEVDFGASLTMGQNSLISCRNESTSPYACCSHPNPSKYCHIRFQKESSDSHLGENSQILASQSSRLLASNKNVVLGRNSKLGLQESAYFFALEGSVAGEFNIGDQSNFDLGFGAAFNINGDFGGAASGVNVNLGDNSYTKVEGKVSLNTQSSLSLAPIAHFLVSPSGVLTYSGAGTITVGTMGTLEIEGQMTLSSINNIAVGDRASLVVQAGAALHVSADINIHNFGFLTVESGFCVVYGTGLEVNAYEHIVLNSDATQPSVICTSNLKKFHALARKYD